MKIVIVGSGNVAFHLSKAIYNSGLQVFQIAARNSIQAIEIAEQVNSKVTTLEEIEPNADIYILAIKDDALSAIAKFLFGKIDENALVVHTSGSTSIAVLEKYFENVGCIYPLQTFSKQKTIDYHSIPFFITSNLLSVQEILIDIASRISKNFTLINDNQRLAIHISAVFVCNFTNHMMTIGSEILHHHFLSFGILKPLIQETVEKAMKFDPIDVQTGPAVRKDYEVMKKHLDFLKLNPDFQKIYSDISENIIEMNDKK